MGTQIAQLVNIPDQSEYLAVLKSRESASINPQVEGWVTDIFVHSGEHVDRGAKLISIDPRVQEAMVNNMIAARNSQAATVANDKTQFDRAQQLYQSGIISKQEFDTARTTYESAQAQLNALDAQVKQQQQQLHYYTVVAPTDGIVGDIPVHVGDRVTTSTLLTTVDQPGRLELYISVPVDHAGQLHIGEPVDILDASGKALGHSTIFFVSPQVDTTTQTVLAKARIPNTSEQFRNEELVTARITWRITKGLEIPILAITRINGQYFCFVVENSSKGPIARQVQIQVGEIRGNNYIVQSGIKPGDHIIVKGSQFVADGTLVKETVENNPSEISAN